MDAFFVVLLADHARLSREAIQPKGDVAELVIAYMRADMHLVITTDELARSVGLSVRQLQRRFREETG